MQEIKARLDAIPGQIQANRSRGELLHEALEAARRKNRAQARRLEEARARRQAITEWIEACLPRREILHQSALARLQARLDSLPVIEQAKGILMAQHRCGPDEASCLLRRASQQANLEPGDLAAQIVGQIATAAANRHPDRTRSTGAQRAG